MFYNRNVSQNPGKDILSLIKELVFMKKFSKNKIALFLACTSVLGGKSQAAQNVKTEQTIAAVGVATSCSNKSVKQGLTKKQKLAIGGAAAFLVVASAIGFTIWGVKKHLNGKSAPDQQDKSGSDIKNGDGEDIESPTKSDKKDKAKDGYFYVEKVKQHLTNDDNKATLSKFNAAVNAINNNQFSEKDKNDFGEFLKVIRGEKKVQDFLVEGVSCSSLTFSENFIGVDLDGITYRLTFFTNVFTMEKIKNNILVESRQLKYNYD